MTMFSVGSPRNSGSGLHDDAPARQALAAVVVGRAHSARTSRPSPGTRRSSGRRSLRSDVDRVVGQALVAVARAISPESIVPTERLMLRIGISIGHRLAALERRRGQLDQPVVERLLQAVVLLLAVVARRPRAASAAGRTREKSRPFAFQCSMPLHVEQVGAPDQLVQRAEPELRHELAHFLGDEEEVVDHVLGLAARTSGAAPDPASPRRPGRCSGGTCAS